MKVPLATQKERATVTPESELEVAVLWYASVLEQSVTERVAQMIELLDIPAIVIQGEPVQSEKQSIIR